MSSQYATLANLAQYAAGAAALSSFSDADKTAALVAASEEADGEFNRRYTLPLTAWGTDVSRAVCEIAAYELLCGPGAFDSANEGNMYRQRALDARAWLKRVGDGTLDPPAIVDATPDAHEGGPAVITDPRRGW